MSELELGSIDRKQRRALHPGTWKPLGVAIACVAVATAARLLLGLLVQNLVGFALYYPAVLIASLVGGRAAGVVALVLGGIMSWWAFMPPHFTVVPPTRDQALNLAVYVLASGLIVATAGSYRQLLQMLRAREAALEVEIAERVRHEEALRRASERNEVLLREIHHRVKNNLQIIVGLLSSHGRDIDNSDLGGLLRQFQGRVLAIARLYDRIQQVETFETVEFSALLRVICADIASSAGDKENIHFGCTHPIVVSTTAAVNLAIVANELITNAIKHADLEYVGSVDVRCEGHDAAISIVIADNGPGLPSGFDVSTCSGFGMNMARRLVEGMGGVLRVLPRAQGAAFQVEVPCENTSAQMVTHQPRKAQDPLPVLVRRNPSTTSRADCC